MRNSIAKDRLLLVDFYGTDFRSGRRDEFRGSDGGQLIPWIMKSFGVFFFFPCQSEKSSAVFFSTLTMVGQSFFLSAVPLQPRPQGNVS